MRKLWILLLAGGLTFAGYLALSRSLERTARVSDEYFILREELPSPDGSHVALGYQYDHGGLGYSRMWWAVVPKNFEQLNLAEYELPDRYRPTRWEENGVLVVETGKMYSSSGDLATGDDIHGVQVRVVPRYGQRLE